MSSSNDQRRADAKARWQAPKVRRVRAGDAELLHGFFHPFASS
ncbi:hypothetical protein [Sphingomonas sp.]|nr:hypothetical protein [Sphingomonas sp.]